MERESFIFYRSFADMLKNLNDENRLRLLDVILDYALDGKEPKEDGLVGAVFALIKPQIDANNRRYVNGSKGGRKPKQNLDVTETEPKRNLKGTEKEPKPNRKRTETEPNVNVNVNVNDNVNVNENDNVNDLAKLVIDYLNKKLGSAYRYSETSLRPIRARLREGYTLEDCKVVINRKYDDWIHDSKMKAYLRPETLFSPKFEGYLNKTDRSNLPGFMKEERKDQIASDADIEEVARMLKA